MTPPEFSPEDVELRDALSALMPAGLEAPTERIHSRVTQLRRRSAMRMAAAVAAAAVVVAVTLAVLPTSSAPGRVRVEGATTVPHRRGGNTPTTAPVSVTTTTWHRGVLAPVTAATTVPTTIPTSTPTTLVIFVPPPTAPRRTTTTKAPETPTTKAPAPAPAPVTVTLVLDDSGLHAPATQVAGGYVTFRFFDQRTDFSAGGHAGIHITPVDPKYAPVDIARAWRDPDMFGHFGAAATYNELAGAVSFQAFSADNNQNIGSPQTTTFSPS